ncbi:hypothetical protein D3C75_1360890 [compost metagenome]
MLTGLRVIHIISGAEIDDTACLDPKQLLLHALIGIERNILFELKRFHLREQH